jgi:putative flippase GtrA
VKLSAEFLRFAGVGAFAAVVNWGSRIFLSRVLDFSAAIVVAYFIGMITAYALNRRFVFQPSGRSVRSEFVRFTLVNLVALAQVWAVSMVLFEYGFPAIGFTWRAEACAHAFGVASPIVTSYFGHRYFSFARGATGAPGG